VGNGRIFERNRHLNLKECKRKERKKLCRDPEEDQEAEDLEAAQEGAALAEDRAEADLEDREALASTDRIFTAVGFSARDGVMDTEAAALAE